MDRLGEHERAGRRGGLLSAAVEAGRAARERTRPPLNFAVTVAGPPEAVFDAFFRAPERWLCRGGTVEPGVGGRVRLEWGDGCVDGRFVQYEPPHTGRFTWQPEGEPLPPTLVVVWVQPAEGAPGRSRVALEHYGFGDGPAWEGPYVGAAVAWSMYLKNLRAVLETGVDLREAGE